MTPFQAFGWICVAATFVLAVCLCAVIIKSTVTQWRNK